MSVCPELWAEHVKWCFIGYSARYSPKILAFGEYNIDDDRTKSQGYPDATRDLENRLIYGFSANLWGYKSPTNAYQVGQMCQGIRERIKTSAIPYSNATRPFCFTGFSIRFAWE